MPTHPTKPPRNILFIMADDLNRAVGAFGHPHVETPHLDRLAARGLRFSEATCPYPLCGPSRTAMVTGRRPESIPMGYNEVNWRAHYDGPTIFEIARAQGLHTARFGKILHHGLPEGPEREAKKAAGEHPSTYADAASFTEEWGGRPEDMEQQASGDQQLLAGQKFKGNAMHLFEVDGDGSELPDYQAAERATAFLQDPPKQPFFLSVGFHKPHTSYVAPRSFYDRYRHLTREDMPANTWGRPENLPEAALAGFGQRHRGMNPEEQLACYQGYLACVSFMDAQVGKVLEALDASGQAEETLIVFCPDHGFHLGEQCDWNKMSFFGPSLRVPMILAGAGVPHAGVASDALVESIDLFPTIHELMGWEVPENHGTSLLPQIENPQSRRDEPTFAWIGLPGGRTGFSIRTRRFRYSAFGPDGEAGATLFDLQADPLEMSNLAGNPDFSRVEEELDEALRRHRKRYVRMI